MSSSLSASQMEQKILTEFLLTRSALPDIIPLEKFRQLFPKNVQKHPHVKHLYRDLQEQRSNQCDKVRKNIQLEAKYGRTQRRIMEKEMKKLKEEEDMEADGDEMMLGMVDVRFLPFPYLLPWTFPMEVVETKILKLRSDFWRSCCSSSDSPTVATSSPGQAYRSQRNT